MNLIEAIKSRRPFRRRCWDSGTWATVEDGQVKTFPNRSWLTMSAAEDLLADDWEIQEPAVTITRTQFWEAIYAAKDELGVVYGKDVGQTLARAVRKLGLEGP